MSKDTPDVVTIDNGIKFVEIVIGKDKRIKMRDLMGNEVRDLQKIGEGLASPTLGSDMALASIIEINGETLPPIRNDMHLVNRAQKFSSREYFELTFKYAEHFREDDADPKAEQG